MQEKSTSQKGFNLEEVKNALIDDVKLRWIVIALLLPISIFLAKGKTPAIITMVSLGIAASLINIAIYFFLSKQNWFMKNYSYYSGFLDVSIASGAIFVTGGINSPLFLLYFVIIFDSVFEHWAKYIFYHLSALIFLQYTAIYLVASKGKIINANTLDYGVKMVFFLIAGAIAFYIAKTIRQQYLAAERVNIEKEALYGELLGANKRLEDKVKKSTEDLERTNFLLVKKNISLLASHEIYRSAGEVKEYSQMLAMILGITVPLMKGSGGALIMENSHSGTFRVEAVKKLGGSGEQIPDNDYDTAKSPALYDVLAKKKTTVWETTDGLNDELLTELAGEGSCIAAPLVMASGKNGVMVIYNKDQRVFKKTDLELMELLGEQVGSLVYSRHLYDEVKIRAAGLEKLMKVIIDVESSIDECDIVATALNEGIRKLFPYCSGVVVIVDETNQLRIKAQFGHKAEIAGRVLPVDSVAGWATRNGRSLFVKELDKLKFYREEVDGIYLRGPSMIAPIFKKGKPVGSLCITRQKMPFGREDSHFLAILSNHVGILLETASLYENIKRDYINTIYALAAAVDAKDHYTHGHSTTVMKYSVKIAEAMRLPADQIDDIKYAGLLHDIGKIGISENILNKPAKLTKEEYSIIKMHPQLGANIISKIESLKKLSPLILAHHEWANGNGYPLGLRGDEIPLGARIIAVADAYSTMTSKRPYRDIMGDEFAIKEFNKFSGIQFDPKVADVMIEILRQEEKEILEKAEREKAAKETADKEKSRKEKPSRVRVNLEEPGTEGHTLRKDGEFYS